ncbi:ATP-binding cassette domain-containing protein [Foetidibacter luteolus]|uniref:ATP-binding cassette domain-containing protein n=1 Tax=Foetidibacter luteolus TaxID=2608880 RepID=UPI001A99A034|nr:ATP-binding cassette domain-containing protein [Foetidibacter luteolus]
MKESNSHTVNVQQTALLGDVSALITVKDLTVKYRQHTVLNNISFTMHRGEQWLVTGKAGIGKSALAKAISGSIYSNGVIDVHFSKSIELKKKVLFVEQWYHFNNSVGLQDFYYQQRYQSSDADDTITVLQDLQQSFGEDVKLAEAANHYVEQLGLSHRLNAPLIQLSSGEQKKLQLVKAFLQNVQVLVIDNPFIGLDVEARQNLNNIFDKLVQTGMHIILIADGEEIPNCITHVAELSEGLLQIETKRAYQQKHSKPEAQPQAFKEISFEHAPLPPFFEAVKLNNVSVKYGAKVVLQGINWRIKKGDKWLLQGHNGAGKSTLLSLLTGDNPQAYANEIYLFDKRRGTGETIWDIKKKIGYTSPELHWYFDANTTCIDTVVSGHFDTTGLYRKPTAEQTEEAEKWLSWLELTAIKNRKLRDVSVGEQRMLLLARALIKNPPLLILDEPCQGLDMHQSRQFVNIVDTLMDNSERTLIYVSHRMDQVPKCITGTMKLDGGKQQPQPQLNEQRA